jgi:hypothetical protein
MSETRQMDVGPNQKRRPTESGIQDSIGRGQSGLAYAASDIAVESDSLILLSCTLASSPPKESFMPASLQKFSDKRKINPNGERLIQCPYRPQKYLLVWDDKEFCRKAEAFGADSLPGCCGSVMTPGHFHRDNSP